MHDSLEKDIDTKLGAPGQRQSHRTLIAKLNADKIRASTKLILITNI